jgi:hypothetical protein
MAEKKRKNKVSLQDELRKNIRDGVTFNEMTRDELLYFYTPLFSPQYPLFLTKGI